MRKVIVLEFMSLDGVMQAPGGPEEDTAEDFRFGGWQAPFEDAVANEVIEQELTAPVEYLLGRKTFEIWETYWPKHDDIWPGINKGMKYVVSSTRNETDWENTTFIQSVDDIKSLKDSEGPDIQVWGSSLLVHLLFENDLVDELRLMTYPIILGHGKKVFADGAVPATYKLEMSKTGPSGVIIARYSRAGDVKTGTVSA